MRIDRRSWLKYITAGATAAGVSQETLAKESITNEAITLHPVVASDVPAHKLPIAFAPDPERFDILRWTLYDRLSIDKGEHFIRTGGGSTYHSDLFADPATGHTWDMCRTNMDRPGSLPCPQQMVVERIFFLFDPENDAHDNITFRRRFTWEFIIGCKSYANGTMMEANTRGRLGDVIRDSNHHPTTLVPADTLILPAPYSLFISSDYYFRMPIQSGPKGGWTFDKDFSVYAFADGVLARGVQ